MQNPQQKSPYAFPPTRFDGIVVQGAVMLAVERQYALVEPVQRRRRMVMLTAGGAAPDVQSIDEFFNAVIVRGLCEVNRLLVAEHPVGAPPEQIADPVVQTIVADQLNKMADALGRHPAVETMRRAATQLIVT